MLMCTYTQMYYANRCTCTGLCIHMCVCMYTHSGLLWKYQSSAGDKATKPCITDGSCPLSCAYIRAQNMKM